jgi:LacI family transcriptional regulator
MDARGDIFLRWSVRGRNRSYHAGPPLPDVRCRHHRDGPRPRTQNSETLGVVVSDIENPHFTQMVRAVEDAAYRRGFRVLLCNTDETPEKQRSYLHVLAAERVVGVILAPSDPADGAIGQVLDMGIPLLAFDRTVDDPRADAVVADNVDGSRRATEHLIAAGHTRIGFVGGLAAIQTGAERLAGYEAAMREHGLAPHVANGEFRIAQAQRATEELLEADVDLTGLIVANNLMTIGALRALRGRGVTVPGDIALVALDDPFWAELVDPPLTALAQPVRRMAESAVNLLFERIGRAKERGPTRATRVVFPFELRVRGSCGTARTYLGDGLRLVGGRSRESGVGSPE